MYFKKLTAVPLFFFVIILIGLTVDIYKSVENGAVHSLFSLVLIFFFHLFIKKLFFHFVKVDQ